MARNDKTAADEGGRKPSENKGEFIVLGALAVFVVIAIAGMMMIEHYGAQKMGDEAQVHHSVDDH